jgi:hypothetical protein
MQVGNDEAAHIEIRPGAQEIGDKEELVFKSPSSSKNCSVSRLMGATDSRRLLCLSIRRHGQVIPALRLVSV